MLTHFLAFTRLFLLWSVVHFPRLWSFDLDAFRSLSLSFLVLLSADCLDLFCTCCHFSLYWVSSAWSWFPVYFLPKTDDSHSSLLIIAVFNSLSLSVSLLVSLAVAAFEPLPLCLLAADCRLLLEVVGVWHYAQSWGPRTMSACTNIIGYIIWTDAFGHKHTQLHMHTYICFPFQHTTSTCMYLIEKTGIELCKQTFFDTWRTTGWEREMDVQIESAQRVWYIYAIIICSTTADYLNGWTNDWQRAVFHLAYITDSFHPSRQRPTTRFRLLLRCLNLVEWGMCSLCSFKNCLIGTGVSQSQPWYWYCTVYLQLWKHKLNSSDYQEMEEKYTELDSVNLSPPAVTNKWFYAKPEL